MRMQQQLGQALETLAAFDCALAHGFNLVVQAAASSRGGSGTGPAAGLGERSTMGDSSTSMNNNAANRNRADEPDMEPDAHGNQSAGS